jgi:hypothetical protein
MILKDITIDLPIEHVRINRCALWVKVRNFEDLSAVGWRKMAGGPGFKEKMISPADMRHKLHTLKRKSTFSVHKNEWVPTYHFWWKEGTLNVTLNVIP